MLLLLLLVLVLLLLLLPTLLALLRCFAATALHASLGTGRGFLLLCRRCCRPAMAKLLPLAATVLLLLLMLLLLLLLRACIVGHGSRISFALPPLLPPRYG